MFLFKVVLFGYKVSPNIVVQEIMFSIDLILLISMCSIYASAVY